MDALEFKLAKRKSCISKKFLDSKGLEILRTYNDFLLTLIK